MPVFRSLTGSSSSLWQPSSASFRITAFGSHSGGAPVAAGKSTRRRREKSVKLVIIYTSLFSPLILLIHTSNSLNSGDPET